MTLLDYLQAIVRTDLAQDAMNMVLEGLLRQIQSVSYFLVGKLEAKQADQLLFPRG